MLLTGLNIDCLEGILEYLELRDLLNVADSNKRLRHASKFVFVRKYGSRKYGLYEWYNNHRDFIESNSFIDAPKFKFILPLLRNFGPFISRITYDDRNAYLGTTPQSYYIMDYINDFCGESLSHLEMIMYYRDVLDCFKNPFTKVKTVELITSFPAPKNSLVRLFPKIQNLKVVLMNNNEPSSEFVRSGCIANHFSCLEYFRMTTCLYPQYKKDIQSTEVYKDFLRLNPQLKHLDLECGNQAEVSILKVFEGREQNPERLDLFDVDDFFNCFNGEKLHLKNVKHLSIDSFCDYPFKEGIPILCNQLETFEIDLLRQFNEHIYDFCENNSSIRKLKIGFCYSEYNNTWIMNYSKLAQCLPLLEEITNIRGKLSVDESLHILPLFKCLKYFRFICSDHFIGESKQFQSQLNDNWSMHIATEKAINYITLKRKI